MKLSLSRKRPFVQAVANGRFRPIADIRKRLHAGAVHVIDPNAQQYRAAGIALILVAAFTVTMIAFERVQSWDGPLLLPLVGAYFLFNFGFVFAAVKAGLQTKAARLGLIAVLVNFVAMLLSHFQVAWTVLSTGSVLLAIIAACMLFKEAAATRT